ncbi:MerR family transcriptional regulator [Dorea formicigenerans]|uniref:MerR family transcriptional regulator n=1 Tax=Dorea formicigenerans TaxID=39486 RepID=UPI003F681061
MILSLKYYSIHEFSKIIGVSAQTLRNWDANGNIDNTENLNSRNLLKIWFK